MTEIIHALSAGDGDAMTAMRRMLATHRIELTRPAFDEIMEHTPDAPGVTYEPGVVGGVKGLWCRPAKARDSTVLLYLHGGAYIVGSAWAYRHHVGQIAARAAMAAFVPDYRLAPEHPFPAAVDDARAVFAALAEQEGLAIAIAGDSAGGGLALALLGVTRSEALRRPFAGVVLSPWTDLALTSPSLTTRAGDDPLLRKELLAGGATPYLNGHDPRDPLASPLYGELAGLPPIQVHVGTAEILFDDARRFTTRAREANVEITLHVWEGMPHVFLSNAGTFAAAGAALDLVAAFLVERLG